MIIVIEQNTSWITYRLDNGAWLDRGSPDGLESLLRLDGVRLEEALNERRESKTGSGEHVYNRYRVFIPTEITISTVRAIRDGKFNGMTLAVPIPL